MGLWRAAAVPSSGVTRGPLAPAPNDTGGPVAERNVMPKKLEAVFLDRDGTLIESQPYLGDPDRVVLLPGTREALRRARSSGVKLFLFTNQSGVGRGYFTIADVEKVNRRMVELLELGDDVFDAVCIAPERPDEPSRYRKPSPLFIQEMLAAHAIPAHAAWMIGDAPTDWEAGLNAGIRTAAIVSDPADDPARDHRLLLGVEAYSSVLDWISTVLN